MNGDRGHTRRKGTYRIANDVRCISHTSLPLSSQNPLEAGAVIHLLFTDGDTEAQRG